MDYRNHSTLDQATRGLMWFACALRDIYLLTLPRQPASNSKSERQAYLVRLAEAFGICQFMASPTFILITFGSVVALAPGLGIDWLLALLVALVAVFIFFVLYTQSVSHVPAKPVVVRDYQPTVRPSHFPSFPEVEIRPPIFLA